MVTCLISDVTGWLKSVSISHDGLEIHLDNDLPHLRLWPTTDCAIMSVFKYLAIGFHIHCKVGIW